MRPRTCRGARSIAAALALSVACGTASVDPDAEPIDGGGVDASATLDAATSTDAATDAGPADAAPSADAATSADAAATDVDAGSCGAHGGACCPEGRCAHPSLTCAGGVCQGACGALDGPCCAGIVCAELGTSCDPATRRCVRATTLPVYSICTDAEEGACAIPSMCFVSLLDTRPMPASTCTVSCGTEPFCPSDASGRGGACVETPAGPQCYLTCEGTDTCDDGFVCVSAPGELGDRFVCAPGEDP